MTIHRTDPQRATTAYADTLQRVPTTPAGASAAQGPGGATNGGPAPAITGPAQAGAVISLSPGAQTFAKALAAAQATPDVRADRVAAARARLAQHDAVDVDALAGKLLGGAAPQSGE